MNQAQAQLDDILDARAKLRSARLAFNNARIALNQCKTALNDTKANWEELLTEVEQRQGRLSFEGALEQEQPVPAAAEAEAKPASSRKRYRPPFSGQHAEGPAA
jgi:hypothetical protein